MKFKIAYLENVPKYFISLYICKPKVRQIKDMHLSIRKIFLSRKYVMMINQILVNKLYSVLYWSLCRSCVHIKCGYERENGLARNTVLLISLSSITDYLNSEREKALILCWYSFIVAYKIL